MIEGRRGGGGGGGRGGGREAVCQIKQGPNLKGVGNKENHAFLSAREVVTALTRGSVLS